MKIQENKETDNTDEKIRQAAKKLFTARGYAGTTVRDVAEAAGVNIALVNYYFRSKEKLFHAIFEENFKEYSKVIQDILQSEKLSLEERIRSYVNTVTDHLKENPHLPMFIMSEMNQNPDLFARNENFNENRLSRSIIMKQISERENEGSIRKVDPLQLELSISALIVFPMLSKAVTMAFHDLSEEEFDRFIEERKKVVADMILSYLSK